MATTREVSHPVVFTTQSPYPLPSQKFMIPASWRRYQLSQLVNKALSLAKPIPFDFLVRGEILRGSLGEWCAERGVGEEETLEIEYFESVMPPQKMSSLPHEDWVSSVSCQAPGYFFTASYDGQIRMYDYSQTLLQSVPVHAAPATSLCVVPTSPSPSTNPNSHLIASASHDRTARITLISPSDSEAGSSTGWTWTSKTIASLHLHTEPLSSISASSSGAHLLTTSSDSLIGVWDTSIPSTDQVPLDDHVQERKKRRKLATNDEDEESKVRRKSPLTVLKSHTARVSGAAFLSEGTAVSAGWDSTVRVWDVENGVCTSTISASSKPFLCVKPLPSSSLSKPNTILVSSTDRTVTQYDIRNSTSTTSSLIASLPHPATPSCIASPPSNPPSTSAPSTGKDHQLVTGAYDGVVRLWDLRSVKTPITSFKVWEGKKGRKVLSIDWSASGVVCVGGEGGVDVWKVGSEAVNGKPAGVS